MIFLIPRYKKISGLNVRAHTLVAADLFSRGVEPDFVFMSSSPGFNFASVPMCGIMLFK